MFHSPSFTNLQDSVQSYTWIPTNKAGKSFKTVQSMANILLDLCGNEMVVDLEDKAKADSINSMVTIKDAEISLEDLSDFDGTRFDLSGDLTSPIEVKKRLLERAESAHPKSEAARDYLLEIARAPYIKGEKHIAYTLETDGAKVLFEEYGEKYLKVKPPLYYAQPQNDKQMQINLANNLPLHNVAQYITLGAFTALIKRLNAQLIVDNSALRARVPAQWLSEIEPRALSKGDMRRTVLVTAGACGAGKGYCVESILGSEIDLKSYGIIWDAAGEAGSTDISHIHAICERYGFDMQAVWVDSDPEKTLCNQLARAIKTGRMTDSFIGAESHVYGRENFKIWYQGLSDKEKEKITFIDNKDSWRFKQPTKMPMPPSWVLEDVKSLQELTYEMEALVASYERVLNSSSMTFYVKPGVKETIHLKEHPTIIKAAMSLAHAREQYTHTYEKKLLSQADGASTLSLRSSRTSELFQRENSAVFSEHSVPTSDSSTQLPRTESGIFF